MKTSSYGRLVYPIFLSLLIGLVWLSLIPANLASPTSAALAASDPVIAAAGDIACDPLSSSFNSGNGSSKSCRQKYTSDLLVNAGLAAVLPLGDVQYYCAGYQAFLQAYDLSWGRFKSISHPVVGNHEYIASADPNGASTGCDLTNAAAAGYFSYFGAAAGNQGQGYYSYDIGAWHLIALNSNCGDTGGCGPNSPQGKWLEADLNAHPNFCTLAYWHIPLFSSGGRAELNSKDLWQTLYNHDVDVILNGHDHIYERFAPQAPNGAADPLRGIREFIVGSGGANHTSLVTTAANSEMRDATTYGILKLTLHPASYDWQFVPEAGKTFTDSGTDVCHGSNPPVMTASPTGTMSQTVTTTPTKTPTVTLTMTNTPTFTPTPNRADMQVWVDSALQDSPSISRGQSLLMSYAGVNNGAAQILSTNLVPVVSSERVIYQVAGINTSFSEIMALPDRDLDSTYWLPWYNNVDLDSQLRFGNVSGSTATVHVLVKGVEMSGSPFSLAAGASVRQSFKGINNGPVKIVSNQKIVAAERVIYKINGINTSFSEMMALPNDALDSTYWLPWYNNVDLDSQLRVGNVSGSTATVHVYIGNVEMSGSPFTLKPGASTRQSFKGINDGPVKIVSNQKIVAAERVIYKVNGGNTSFSEMMALPNEQLDRVYWFPWYNNAGLDTQLRFGNVDTATATVHVYIGGTEMTGSPFTLKPGDSTRQSFKGINHGPVEVVSNVNIVVAERFLYKANNLNTSFSEMMGLPGKQLDTVYWLPWYNNVDLNTQLRLAVP